MPLEIEIKIRLSEDVVQQLRTRLGPPATSVFEVNRLFDNADGTLAREGCGLRIRAEQSAAGNRGILTYKGPKQPGPLKIREELESLIEQPALVAEILGRIGYHERILYEKRRDTWHVDDSEVTLDELPKLGWFAEIEGPSEQAVTALLHKLELDRCERIDESYVELTDQQGDAVAGGKALTFS